MNDRHDGSIYRNGAIDMSLLARLAEAPEPFSSAGRDFWKDPYVSDQLVEALLDPEEHEASRPEPYLSMTVTSIHRTAESLGLAGGRLLELGSGAGQYAEAFAVLGYSVTGVDFCEAAVREARTNVGNLPIQYHVQDIRSYEPQPERYSVATMIYGTFGVLAPDDQSRLLQRITDALQPGGLFVFDVFTEHYARAARAQDGWFPSESDGFWQADPHITLNRNHHYPNGISLERNVVIEENGAYRVYDSWWKSFSTSEIVQLVQDHGLHVQHVYGSLWKTPHNPTGDWMALYCVKPR